MPGNPKTRRIVEEFAYSQNPKWFTKTAVLVIEPLSQSYKGRHAIKVMLDRLYREAFSDASAELVNVAADSERGLGFVEFIFRGTHIGKFANFEPSGKNIEIPMLAVCEIDGELIKRARLYCDMTVVLEKGA